MRARLISIFLLFFSTSIVVHSQDIYRLKYKSTDVNDKAIYDAFFSISSNGNGFARIKSSDNKDITVEMTFQEQYATDNEGMPDTTQLVYQGMMDPANMKGNRKFNFSPVTFWFKMNKENTYDPWAVTPSVVNSAPSGSNIISAEFIKIDSLASKKELVLNFFKDTSAYYKNLPGIKSKGLLSPEEREERKNTHMYLVVVASTYDTTLKPNCLIDARKVVNKFSEIAKNALALPPANIHIDSIYGSNYSRASVEAALKRIPKNNKKNNLIIFYYSGHGFHNNKVPDKLYPFFDLRDPSKQKFYRDLETQTLNVKDIYDTILTKGARFNLVLSDCCNDTVAAPKKMGLPLPGHKGLEKKDIDNAKALFLKDTVSILMTAASKGEEAVVTPSFNSYFTYFFLSSLDTYLSPANKYPAWPLLQADAKSQTMRQVNGLPCKEKINCPKQTPKALIPGIK